MAEKILFSKKIRIVVSYDGQKLMETSFHQGPITFGRMPTNDVHLDYPFVSRSHCQVVEEGGKVFLKDLGSRNGIAINGVTQPLFEVSGKLDFKLDKLLVEIYVEAKTLQKPNPAESLQTAETIIQKTPIAAPKTPSQILISDQQQKQKIPGVARAVKVPLDAAKSSAAAKTASSEVHGHRNSLAERSFTADLVEYHPGIRSAAQKKLEAVVYWQDQVFEVREFEPQERVTVGSSLAAALNIPVIPKGWALAQVEFDQAQCFVPKDRDFSVVRDGHTFSLQDLIGTNQASPKGKGFTFKMGQHDVVNVDLGDGMKIYLRYVPATKSLTRKKLSEPDFAIKQAMLGSAIIHGIVSLMLIIMAPISKNVPKLKNVPERYARLLVEPPKPIIPVPEPPPPPPPPEIKKEVAKPEPKKPEPKKIVKVEKTKPKKMELPKKLEKQNKFPMIVRTPVTPPPKVQPPAPKLESLGALAALGAIGSDPSPAPAMNNIKIDKNAGGLASKTPNTQGIMGALPSTNGKLMAVGNGSVKTGGKGIGSGTAYGTQGLSGGAGTRGVAGAVVGPPKLASSNKVEGLTRAQVMEEVQKHLAEVQACYERSLLSNPGLAGRMEFEWDIQASGSVAAVRIKRSTVNGGDALGSCVKGVFSAMRFPTAKNGQGTTPNIGFPFGRL